jgi:hypothetical protein
MNTMIYICLTILHQRLDLNIIKLWTFPRGIRCIRSGEGIKPPVFHLLRY